MNRQKNQQKNLPLSKKFSFRNILLFAFVFFLPTQFGKHFFLNFSYVSGVRVDYLSPALYFIDILAILLIFANWRAVARFFGRRVILLPLSILLVPVIFSQVPEISLYRYTRIIEVLAVFAVFRNIQPKLGIIVWALFASTIGSLFLALVQFTTLMSVQGLMYYLGERPLSLSYPGIATATIQGVEFLRPYATFSHPNSLAGFYLLVYSFILFAGTRIQPLPKNLILVGASMLILLSFSKTALIGYLAINLLYILQKKTDIDCRLCIIAKLAVLVVLAALFLNTTTDPASLNKRIILSKEALQVIIDHPVWGVGLGSYVTAAGGLVNLKYPGFFAQPVHNIFLLWIAECGIIIGGYILFVLARYIRRNKHNMPLMGCGIAILGTGLFDHYWLTLVQNMLGAAVLLSIAQSFESSRPT